jgi:hypothetical protein
MPARQVCEEKMGSVSESPAAHNERYISIPQIVIYISQKDHGLIHVGSLIGGWVFKKIKAKAGAEGSHD